MGRLRGLGRIIRDIRVRSMKCCKPRHNVSVPGESRRRRPTKPPSWAIQRTACSATGAPPVGSGPEGWHQTTPAIHRGPAQRFMACPAPPAPTSGQENPPALTLDSVQQRGKHSRHSPVGVLQDDTHFCTSRCQTSRPHRHASPSRRWLASATVSTGTVVTNRQAMGVLSAGGSPSWPGTAHRGTTGKSARWRWRGGHRVKGQNRRANGASRAVCRPRRGTCYWRWATTGCAATVAHPSRAGPRTPRSHAAHLRSATPAGRGAAPTAATSPSRSPTRPKRGGGQPSWAGSTASRR